MSSEKHGTGLVDTVKEMAPALSGNPMAVWSAARHGTQAAASALPDTMGLDHVKDFVRRYPVVTTVAALVVGYYFLGGALFGRKR